jgi:hypothetical protein
MRPSHSRLKARRLAFAAVLIGMDAAAVYWVAAAKSAIIPGSGGRYAHGPLEALPKMGRRAPLFATT